MPFLPLLMGQPVTPVLRSASVAIAVAEFAVAEPITPLPVEKAGSEVLALTLADGLGMTGIADGSGLAIALTELAASPGDSSINSQAGVDAVGLGMVAALAALLRDGGGLLRVGLQEQAAIPFRPI